jgi:hypothetical protein
MRFLRDALSMGPQKNAKLEEKKGSWKLDLRFVMGLQRAEFGYLIRTAIRHYLVSGER